MEVIPVIVPKPMDFVGLKKTLLLTLESNMLIDFLILNESGTNDTEEVAVWDTPIAPLSTLNNLLFLYTSNNFKVSSPILILLPTETFSGILETHISVLTPTMDATDPSGYVKDASEVVNPTTLVPFNSDNWVERPEITILSLFSQLWDGSILTFTFSLSTHVNTTSL